VGSSFGSHLWERAPGVLNQHIFKVGLGDSIDKRYAFHALRYITEEIEQQVSGAVGLVHITKEKLNEFTIPLPSMKEQERIVGILDEAFAGIATAKANAEKNLQNARALFESHLQSIFTRRGDGWVDRQLASLCTEITVGHVGPMKTEYRTHGVPFLRSQNIRPFDVSMDNVMFVDETFHRALKKSRLRPGDLAIVRTGYPGTAAVIPPELPDANCSDLVIVRPGDTVSPHFLAAFFNSAFGKQMVLGKLVGAAQKHFNVTAAKEVVLHVPPLSEQREIVRAVDLLRTETQRLESLYQRKLAALDALKQSLLHQAFSGQL
jgi:type I restriction enzyme S subunit